MAKTKYDRIYMELRGRIENGVYACQEMLGEHVG